MIPRIIHQTWEGRTHYLGDHYSMLSDTWKEHHPDWKYEFWDGTRMDDFVYNYFPEMIDLYFGYQYNIQRWHVIRYLILYQMGGMYVDFDYECLECFDNYIKDESKCYFAIEPEQHFQSFGRGKYINNALMISPPGHPFFKYIISHLYSSSISYRGDKYLEVLNTTGSLMLTKLYREYTDTRALAILPSERVSPFSRDEIQDYIHGKANEKLLNRKLKKAYAIHYFLNSWISKYDNSFFFRSGLSYTPISYLYQVFKQYPLICIDTNSCLQDSLFFAVQSYSTDGNKFAAKALEKGCRYAVVDNPKVIINNRYILVDNVLQALQQLADYHHQILKTPVIGVTGTCGKTTTVELTAAVLSTKYNIVSTPASENASLGVSLTLLRLKPEHEIAIIEMGACCSGMIRELARIARPNYGIITNVGLAHLEGFGSFEGVINSKGELYDYLRRTCGVVFIHKENIHLQSIAEGLVKISYGESEDALITGRVVSSEPYLCLDWKNAETWHTISTHMVGDYNLYNVLAAITVGIYFNVPSTEINRAISNYVPTNHRSQLKMTLRNKLIIDSFNANPTSMQAALTSFSKLAENPKAVILGDMLGLGSESLKLHFEIIENLNRYNFEKVLLCGNQFISTNSSYQCFDDVNALREYLSENPFQGYNVLIKGSNKMHLSMIINLL